jgi:hypothetical protein
MLSSAATDPVLLPTFCAKLLTGFNFSVEGEIYNRRGDGILQRSGCRLAWPSEYITWFEHHTACGSLGVSYSPKTLLMKRTEEGGPMVAHHIRFSDELRQHI